MLSTRSATALYVGAVLGPGVLFLPALAARVAGPASILAWVGLLALSVPLAITFAALGIRQPEAGGTAAYVTRAFGRRAGEATGWWFLVAVACGAPAVALIGGNYVAELVGGGRDTALIAAAAMIGAVVTVNARGLHTTAKAQLAFAGLLAVLLLVAALTALPHTEASNWTPFAPHGWGAIGSAASVLMLSFIGWEAVSHLAGELPNPAHQLPRAIGAALVIVVVLYLGLAAATVGVGATSSVPLADLMQAGLGKPGRTVTAGLAVLLTMGSMNTYVAAATNLAGTLTPASRGRALTVFAGVAGAILLPLALEIISLEGLMRAVSALFVAVYVTSTAAGVKLLDGKARASAGIGLAAVLVIFAFSGLYILVPIAITIVLGVRWRPEKIGRAGRQSRSEARA